MVAAFDVSPGKVGESIGGIKVHHMDDLAEVMGNCQAKLAVIAVPASAARQVAEKLCEVGVVGILNFAPVAIQTSDTVAVRPVDIAALLEHLTFQAINSD